MQFGFASSSQHRAPKTLKISCAALVIPKDSLSIKVYTNELIQGGRPPTELQEAAAIRNTGNGMRGLELSLPAYSLYPLRVRRSLGTVFNSQ